MKTNFKIRAFLKNHSTILLFLALVIILIVVFVVFISIRTIFCQEKQIKSLKEQIVQLETIVKQLTGGIPPEGLRSVSGVVLSQNDLLGKESMLLEVNVAEIDVRAETLDFSLIFPPAGKSLLEVEVTSDTKISLVMSGEEKEINNPVVLFFNYNDFKANFSPPYAVQVQTSSQNPAQQKRITAFSLTIFFDLKLPEPPEIFQ